MRYRYAARVLSALSNRSPPNVLSTHRACFFKRAFVQISAGGRERFGAAVIQRQIISSRILRSRTSLRPHRCLHRTLRGGGLSSRCDRSVKPTEEIDREKIRYPVYVRTKEMTFSMHRKMNRIVSIARSTANNCRRKVIVNISKLISDGLSNDPAHFPFR